MSITIGIVKCGNESKGMGPRRKSPIADVDDAFNERMEEISSRRKTACDDASERGFMPSAQVCRRQRRRGQDIQWGGEVVGDVDAQDFEVQDRGRF